MKTIHLFLQQIKSPLVLLLFGAALLSYFLGGKGDALLIFLILFLSALLGFFEEWKASRVMEALLARVAIHAEVYRNGEWREIPLSQVVPNDLFRVRAGDLIPADATLVEIHHLFVNESPLTGESEPVEKEIHQPLFFGATVISGWGVARAEKIGTETRFGSIVRSLERPAPETAFEVGVRKFGTLLLGITLLLIGFIFVLNAVLGRPFLESLLFALALAVGLTPQLLPAIIAVNLAKGARRMASKQVVVKRLAALENFGLMDVLLADKTGTLTEGTLSLVSAVNLKGESDPEVLQLAALNAYFQTGYANPLDQAILKSGTWDFASWQKEDEIPYDFSRKRLTIAVSNGTNRLFITKGAVLPLLSICSLDGEALAFFEQKASEGFRLIGVATGETEDETHLTFRGFLIFEDLPKPDVKKTILRLRERGLELKIVTGDHHLVATSLANQLGVFDKAPVTRQQLLTAPNREQLILERSVFAELEPQDKEEIATVLRKAGKVVGVLGDGINDVSALHVADVGISVDTAADAAKEAADFVLLKKDLNVLLSGIEEGRKTFVNTQKYVYMASSANFGNMFSMAGASLFVPFLPLLPYQVLLINFLTDLPEMTIATDRIDSEQLAKPSRWDTHQIWRFMFLFGLISSVFDYTTFFLLLHLFDDNPVLFRTGWFVESIASATLIVLAVRTKRLFFRSKPSRPLLLSILAILLSTLILPTSKWFGLAPLNKEYYPCLLLILSSYFLTVEIAKKFFWRMKPHM